MKVVRFHPQAEAEFGASVEYYEMREAGLGVDMEREVLRGMVEIRDAPHRWPVYGHGTRQYLLHRFPFRLVYLELPDALWIVAVAHCSRKPGYWKKRLGDAGPQMGR